ncbi:MAG: MFS transporter [Candidatus Promineifilaceae bacterium]|nr:MFS transporter [Candidatus Promineifilaceae bacterium]
MIGAVAWQRRLLRRLLQLDHATPEVDDAAVEAFRAANYRWNFATNLLDGASFWFGLSFISSSTILPLFISRLSDSPLPLGIVAVIAQGGWFLPQLFTARRTERLARNKPVVVNLGFFTERLPLWLMPLAALLALVSPAVALALLLLAYAWHAVGAGLIATAWQELIARCFPVVQRGRFLGLSTFIGTGAGALGGFLSSWLLETMPFPQNFALVFAIAAGAISLSWLFLALVREPVQQPRDLPADRRAFRTDLGNILRRDRNFRRFLLGRALLALAGMGQGFLAVAAVQRWALSDGAAGLFTAAMLGGQTAGTLLFGLLADRFGHKLSLELSALAALAAYLLAWLAPDPRWFYAVFALLGLLLGGVLVSGILVVLEFAPAGRRPTYVGLANTGVGVVGVTAPLVGAGLAALGFDLLFVLSAAAALASLLVLRFAVQEPRWAE